MAREVVEIPFPILTEKVAVQAQVVIKHSLSREMPLHVRARFGAIQPCNAADGRYGGINISSSDQESADAVLDQLRHRATPIRNHRCACRHRLDHRQAEWLVELNEMQQRRRAT